MTYLEAQTLFLTAKSPTQGKPLPGKATRLVKTDRGYGIKYHNTIVVEILPNDTYILRTGGYYSRTTKKRINQYTNLHLFQRKNKWYVNDYIPFTEGMCFTYMN